MFAESVKAHDIADRSTGPLEGSDAGTASQGPSPRYREALREIDRLIDAGLRVDRPAILRQFADVADELAGHFQLADLLREVADSEQARSSAARAPVAIPSFGDYEVLEQIGRGGMGVVYKARQKSLSRLVALKFPEGGAWSGERSTQEALALAQLQHPHIVAIHEVGEHDGRPYLSMEYVPGVNLAELLQTAPPEQRRAVEYAHAIAAAIAYAHARGIVHRDLKPANILVDEDGEIRVADFGLGKVLAEDHSLTQTGQILGTLRYMAPEQTEDSRKSPMSGDIYAIGAILYELLSGRPAFWANSTAALVRQIFEQDPLPLRQLEPRIPVDLETICQKCLSKLPAERYQTAAALADDLQRFLDGKPVLARPIGGMEQAWRWCRRRPLVAGLSGATVLAVVTGVVLSGFFWRAAVRGREEAVEAKQLAERNADAAGKLALRSQREAAMYRVQRVRLPPRRAGWSADARKLVVEAVEVERDERARDELAACLAGVDAERTHVWSFRSSSAAFSPDGARLLTGGGYEGNTRLWQIATGEFQESQHPGRGPVAFTTTGEPVQWAADSPWTFTLWNIATQMSLCSVHIPLPDGTNTPTDSGETKRLMDRVCLALSRDTGLLAASVPMPNETGNWPATHGTTVVWSARGELLRTIEGAASGLCFTPDNALLAVGRPDGRIELINLARETPRIVFDQGANAIHGMDFIASPLRIDADSSWLLAAGDAGGGVTVWDVAKRQPRSRCLGSTWSVYAVCFAPDGMTLATGGRGGARLWNFMTGQPLLYTLATGDFITDLRFSGDGQQLAVASHSLPYSAGQATTVFSFRHGRGIDILHGMSSQIAQTCLSSDGRYVAVMGQNWEVGVYELRPPRLNYIVQGPIGHFADNAAVVLSDDNRYLGVSAGSEVRLWELETGRLASRYNLPPGLVDQLAFTPDGKLLSFRWECLDGQTPPWENAGGVAGPRVLRLRNIFGDDPGQALAEIPHFGGRVLKTCAHPEGRFFVAEGQLRAGEVNAEEIIAIDGVSGTAIWKIVPPRPEVWPILDPTGDTLSFADWTHACAVECDLASGERRLRLPPHPWALGPNGRGYLSRIDLDFDHAEGRGLAWWRDEGPKRFVVLGSDFKAHANSPRFSRDGQLVIFGTDEGLVLICDLPEIERQLSELRQDSP